STCKLRARDAERYGSNASTRIPKAIARRLSSLPIRPIPIMPRVLLYSSTPSRFFRSQVPPFNVASARAMFRARLSSSEKVCSAVEMVFAPGAFSTTTPRRVAISTSTLSTPTPARPTTRSFFAAFKIFAVTFVWLRMMSAAKSGMASANCVSLNPACTLASRAPSRVSSSIPRCEMESAMKTFGVIGKQTPNVQRRTPNVQCRGRNLRLHSSSDDHQLSSQPATDPRPPTVESQSDQLSRGNELIDLRPRRSAFVTFTEVIIDHDPAPVRQPVAIAIEIAPDVVVGIENKQTDSARDGCFPDRLNCCWLERTTVDQSDAIEQIGARQIFLEIFEDIFAREVMIFQSASGFDADDFLFSTGIPHTQSRGDGRSAQKRTNFKNVSFALPGKIMDHDKGIDTEHGNSGRFPQSVVQSFGLPIFDQGLHQLEALSSVIVWIHVTGSGTD